MKTRLHVVVYKSTGNNPLEKKDEVVLKNLRNLGKFLTSAGHKPQDIREWINCIRDAVVPKLNDYRFVKEIRVGSDIYQVIYRKISYYK